MTKAILDRSALTRTLHPRLTPWGYGVTFVVIMVGIYTSLSLQVGDSEVKSAYGLLAAGALTAFYIDAVTDKAPALAWTFAALCLSLFAAAFHGTPLDKGVATIGLTCLSIVVAVAFMRCVEGQAQDQTRLVLFGLLAFIVIFAAMETYIHAIQAFSNSIRRVLYTKFYYASDVRDVLFYGAVRPKVLSQEPNFPAKFAAYFLLCLSVISTRKVHFIGLALLGLGILLWLKSPSLYGAVILAGSLYGAKWALRNGVPASTINAAIIAIVIAGVLATSSVSAIATIIGGERGQQLAEKVEGSSVSRLLAPPVIFAKVMLEEGPFGAGPSYKQRLDSMARATMAESFHLYNPQEDTDNTATWGNGFYDLLISLGPVLALVVIIALPFLFPIDGLFAFPILVFFVVFLLDAGMSLPRNWLLMALICACANIFISGSRSAPLRRPSGPGASRRSGVAEARADQIAP